MFALDLEAMLLALLLTYTLLCVLVVYVLVGAFLLVQHTTSVLARVLHPPVHRFFCAVCRKTRTKQPPRAAYTLGQPADHETQHGAFPYLIMLAHHGRHP